LSTRSAPHARSSAKSEVIVVGSQSILGAFREKDQNFVAALVRSALVDRKTILTRLSGVDERYRPAAEMAASWLRSLYIGS